MVATKKPLRGAPRKPVELKDGPKVRLDEIYPASVLCGIVGWGSEAFKNARAAGLRVRKAGGKLFVCGTDFAIYLDSLDSTDRGLAEQN